VEYQELHKDLIKKESKDAQEWKITEERTVILE
jgi:hypothetical protein